MKDSDKEIDYTLSSFDGIERAEASPFLFGRILERMKKESPIVYYSGKKVLQFALAALFLISMNIFSVLLLKKQTKPKVNEQLQLNQVAQEYFGSENTTVVIY